MININYDILLMYLSGRKQGTISQFKSYINNLDYACEIENLEYKPYSQIS